MRGEEGGRRGARIVEERGEGKLAEKTKRRERKRDSAKLPSQRLCDLDSPSLPRSRSLMNV